MNSVPAGLVSSDRFAVEASRKRRFESATNLILGFGFPLVLLGLWEMAARGGLVDRRFFPAPSVIVESMLQLLASAADRHTLIIDLLVTLRRVMIGFVIGGTAGVALGVVMGLNRLTRAAIAPLLYTLYPLPKIAIYPLAIIIFGLGDASNIALVTLGVFFMATINSLSGVFYTNAIYHDVSKAFRLPPMTRWFRVFIPSAMPAIITGLRLGIGQALVLVISAEFVSSDDGLGRFIWDAWQVLDIPRMFMGLLVVLMLAGAAALLGNVAERLLVPWRR